MNTSTMNTPIPADLANLDLEHVAAGKFPGPVSGGYYGPSPVYGGSYGSTALAYRPAASFGGHHHHHVHHHHHGHH